MIKKAAETIIGGAFGLLALYLVGRVAYQAGQDIAREECRYQAMQAQNNQTHTKEEIKELPGEELGLAPAYAPVTARRRKKSVLSMLSGVKSIFGNRQSVIGHLVKNPEDHRFEAYVEGDELQIHVKRKGEVS